MIDRASRAGAIVAIALLAPAFAVSCRRESPGTNDAAPVASASASASASEVASAAPSVAPSASSSASSAAPTEIFGPEVAAILEAATAKMNAADGKGCLAELDSYDAGGPKHPTSDPLSSFAYLRGQCLMLAGKCNDGKALLRKTYAAKQGLAMGGPEQIERAVDAMVGIYCTGDDVEPRDRMLRALWQLNQGAYMSKKTPAECTKAYETAKRLKPTVKPRDEDDTQITQAPKVLYFTAAQCLAKAGDCKAAWKVFRESYPMETLDAVKDAKQKESIVKQAFDSSIERCKEK